MGDRVQTEFETDIGTLRHTEVGEEEFGDEEMALSFHFASFEEIHRRQLPSELRSVPYDSRLTLVKAEDGDLVLTRSLAEFEAEYCRRLINSNTEYEFDSSVDLTGGFAQNSDHIFLSNGGESDEEAKTFGLSAAEGSVDITGRVTSLSPPTTEIQEDYDLTDAHHHCSGLATHPCTICAGSAGVFSGCLGTCIGTAGASCALCLVTGGIGTHTCCVCLTCYDGIDWEDNSTIRRTCPGDLVDAAIEGSHDELEDIVDEYV